MKKYKSRKQYKSQLNKALLVLYQAINELDYFAVASPVSSQIETVARIEWLKARISESIVIISENGEITESMINLQPWPPTPPQT